MCIYWNFAVVTLYHHRSSLIKSLFPALTRNQTSPRCSTKRWRVTTIVILPKFPRRTERTVSCSAASLGDELNVSSKSLSYPVSSKNVRDLDLIKMLNPSLVPYFKITSLAFNLHEPSLHAQCIVLFGFLNSIMTGTGHFGCTCRLYEKSE